jgi:hypothetical protein
MTPRSRFSLRSSLAALVLVAAAPVAALAQEDGSTILDAVKVRQLVASPAPADQSALAAHFGALAERFDADARRHEAMAAAVPGGPRSPNAEMRPHCQRLARLGREAAGTLRALAAHHASLAGGIPSTPPPAGRTYQAGAAARQPTDADLSALAGRASSPADHRTLEDYFRTFAARYRDQADAHVAMAALYRTTSRLAPVAAHCDRLVTQLRAVQHEAQAAAAMHGALAGGK